MIAVIETLLGAALLLAGMSLLALAMPRHYRQCFPGKRLTPLRQRGLRVAGFASLALSLAALVAGWGWALGVLYGFGLASLLTVLPVLFLAFRGR